jgi:hypothetical protein
MFPLFTHRLSPLSICERVRIEVYLPLVSLLICILFKLFSILRRHDYLPVYMGKIIADSLSLSFLLPPFWDIGHPWNALFLFSFLILRQSVGLLGWGISPSQGRYLYKHRQTSMSRVGLEPTIVHALNRAAVDRLSLRGIIHQMKLSLYLIKLHALKAWRVEV